MRTREEIEASRDKVTNSYSNGVLQLEVLLDIRELLQDSIKRK